MEKKDFLEEIVRACIKQVIEGEYYEKYFDSCDLQFNRLGKVLFSERNHLTVGEVALVEGKCQKTILRYIKKGYLKATKLPGSKSYQISREDFNNYKLGLKQRKHSA
jgi:excisionase family DNA binding protein